MERQVQTKLGSVVRSLRKDIVHGVHKAGQRLPSQSEIGAKLGVGVSTVQRALRTLAEDGFVGMNARRSGTFVVEHPPHLCRYGLVVSSAWQWSQFVTSLREAAKYIETGSTVRFSEYHSSRDVRVSSELTKLSRDVQRHCLAGLIFVGVISEWGIDRTPIIREPSMPRVLIGPRSEYGLPSIHADMDCFMDRAIEYLVSKGRRRIAHLCTDFPEHPPSVLVEFENSLRKRGIEVRPYWVQPVPAVRVARSASRVVNVMMHLEGDRRPDALIVHDDNLIEPAVAGLMTAGVKVPDELDIVALSNFPASVPSALPIVRLGFDLRSILKHCLIILKAQQEGETLPRIMKVPAIFEDELTT